MKIVICGLSLTSSWGNGHATTFRALIKALKARGHEILFLERDRPWYASNRDLSNPNYCRVALYTSLSELRETYQNEIRNADVVIVGSFVPDGVAIGEWVTQTARGITAFYDIDTPVTFSRIDQLHSQKPDQEMYLNRPLVARYDLYLSFTGGPLLRRIERDYGSPAARALYCSFDPTLYYHETNISPDWDLGYLGTYSVDRQTSLKNFLIASAQSLQSGRFVVAGAQYPSAVSWPENVTHIPHLPPSMHRHFYNQQRFTLNITRQEMKLVGHSPSVRLFEAAACGTPIISDFWPGLDHFFQFGSEVIIARETKDVLTALRETSEKDRRLIGTRARERVLAQHTCLHRALELEKYIQERMEFKSKQRTALKPARNRALCRIDNLPA